MFLKKIGEGCLLAVKIEQRQVGERDAFHWRNRLPRFASDERLCRS
jgi:hypothetical protein